MVAVAVSPDGKRRVGHRPVCAPVVAARGNPYMEGRLGCAPDSRSQPDSKTHAAGARFRDLGSIRIFGSHPANHGRSYDSRVYSPVFSDGTLGITSLRGVTRWDEIGRGTLAVRTQTWTCADTGAAYLRAAGDGRRSVQRPRLVPRAEPPRRDRRQPHHPTVRSSRSHPTAKQSQRRRELCVLERRNR